MSERDDLDEGITHASKAIQSMITYGLNFLEDKIAETRDSGSSNFKKIPKRKEKKKKKKASS